MKILPDDHRVEYVNKFSMPLKNREIDELRAVIDDYIYLKWNFVVFLY